MLNVSSETPRDFPCLQVRATVIESAVVFAGSMLMEATFRVQGRKGPALRQSQEQSCHVGDFI